MDELLDAIKLALTDSALWNDVDGRCYHEDDITSTVDYPNVIYSMFGNPHKTFTEHHYDITVQFNLRAARTSGSVIIRTMYNDLLALFDDQPLTVSGYQVEWFRESGWISMPDDVDVLSDGTTLINQRVVDFTVSLNKI